MKYYSIGTCGYYDTQNTIANGQTIRTHSVTNEIIAQVGEGNVKTISSYGWKKNPVGFLLHLLKLEKQCKNLIVFPDENGVKVIVPLLCIFGRLLHTQVFYVVIGGWLPVCLQDHRWLISSMKKLSGIFVQTSTLKHSLNRLGIEKVHIFPNFKRIRSYGIEELNYTFVPPYSLCFFSRITEQKGVEEMIQVINNVNQDGLSVKFTLDIYGAISPEYESRFVQLQQSFPTYIRYKGVIDGWKTTEILKDYFMQLFPTKYKTEGFPGSILDSFYAGLPVLASRWNSYGDIIEDGVDSMTFGFNDFKDMQVKLEHIYDNPDVIIRMKPNCIINAHKLDPKHVIYILLNELS